MEGDFRIDLWLVQPQLNTIVSPDNAPVQLEPKVMEVLVYLADHAGEVVSKESLLQALWGDTFVTENSLTRCIADLRKAFNDDADEPRFIQTITKKGYRLIAQVSKLKAPASRYEILEKLGEGGMGQVFLARDGELQRKVALKFIREADAEEESARKRLLREARAAASLDHPFIGKVFDTGQMDGKTFIAMEYVEGQTLKQKLAKGSLEMKEALRVASENAEALEAAHDRGIVHRDLKPSNIILTPQGHVKVMDFGLAKQIPQTGASQSSEETLSALTREGTTTGTLPYMSPEQLRAEEVDRRTDVFSFGVVLFEMIAGLHPYEMKSVIETAAAILEGEPDWSLLPSGTPAQIRALLRRCLQKDIGRRQHYMTDVRIEIDDATSPPDIAGAQIKSEAPANGLPKPLTAPRRFSLPWLAACAVVMMVAGVLMERLLTKYFQPPPFASVVRTTIKVEPGLWLDGMRRAIERERPSRTAMTISSDGRFVVYSAIPENPAPEAKPQLYIRRMDQSEAKPIAGTEGGINPFLSPDNRWVGFWADRKLKKAPVGGGVPATLCDVPSIWGASWGGDNNILFTGNVSAGLSRISADGGTPVRLTVPDSKREEYSHGMPFCLPNGKAVLFTVMRHAWDSRPCLALLRLDTLEWQVPLQDAADAKYVPTGHLVFLRQGSLMGVRFDPARLEVIGQPSPLLGNVMQAFASGSGYNTGSGQFDVSASGALIYAAGGILPDQQNSLVWVDQKGIEQPSHPCRCPFSHRVFHRMANESPT